MTSPKRIGVLGGMGPEATVLFQQRLIAATPAKDDADHIPLIVDMNPQVPSRIARLIDGTGADPAPVLATMARRLYAAGAEALVMPCNTAHAYAEAIAPAVPIPFLHMVNLAARRATGRVGMLASPATARIGLWERALAGPVLWPKDLEAVLAAIRAVKAGDTQTPRSTLAAAADDLRGQGAETLLIGCSEFSLLADTVPDAVDSIDLLVEETKAFAFS